jgi:mevalonate kinase
MKQQIKVSAPGKLMLFGEHAAVYGYPCIATAVNQRLSLTINILDNRDLILNAPELGLSAYAKNISDIGIGEIPKAAQIIESAVGCWNEKYPLKTGVEITTKCGFSPLYGFGSSSAAAVCAIKALSLITTKLIDNQEVFDLAFTAVRKIQPLNSGFDIATAVWGGTLLYQLNQKVIPIKFFGNNSTVSLMVGYTGIKADTPTLVKQVAELKKKNSQTVDRIFKAISEIVVQAKIAFLKSDFETIGKLMNFNQEYLRNLGSSSEKLEALIMAAKNAGAYGAKLSGAGGGDCMIALAPISRFKNVKEAIKTAGGEPVEATMEAEGLEYENYNG